MIKLIAGLPDNVIAFTASGRVTDDDYKTVVAPAAIAIRAPSGTRRLLYHVPPEFKKFTTTALWDDTHIGLHRLQGFERVAVVTDIQWIRSLATGIRPTGSMDIKIFSHVDFDEARHWICA